jgi:hypothetical protein
MWTLSAVITSPPPAETLVERRDDLGIRHAFKLFGGQSFLDFGCRVAPAGLHLVGAPAGTIHLRGDALAPLVQLDFLSLRLFGSGREQGRLPRRLLLVFLGGDGHAVLG